MDITKIDGDYIENLLNRLVSQYYMNWDLILQNNKIDDLRGEL